MYKLLFFIVFSSACSCHAFAQTEEEVITDSVIYTPPVTDEDVDTSASGFAKEVLGDTLINFRDIDISSDSINAKKNKKGYLWIKSMDSLLHALEKQAKNESSKATLPSAPSAMDRFFGSAFLEILLWILAGGAVIFIIFQLFLNKGAFRSTTRRRKMQETADEDDTDITGKDYASLARRAAVAGEYRRATRFLFLMTLQKLQDAGLIVYAADKTNSAYLREIPADKRNDFARLSLYYEYIWYGNTPLEKEIFENVETKFSAFLNRI